MRKTIILVALALSGMLSHAQEVIELKEANVGFTPSILHLSDQGNYFTVDIKETYTGEFEQDPVRFMHTYFNIKDVIASLGGQENYSYYNVQFRSNKGELHARFNKLGTLLSSYSKFRDIVVPTPLQHQLYRDHKGWAMVTNQHVKRENNGSVKSDFYRVTMKKGNKKKNLKIHTSDIDGSLTVASN